MLPGVAVIELGASVIVAVVVTVIVAVRVAGVAVIAGHTFESGSTGCRNSWGCCHRGWGGIVADYCCHRCWQGCCCGLITRLPATTAIMVGEARSVTCIAVSVAGIVLM